MNRPAPWTATRRQFLAGTAIAAAGACAPLLVLARQEKAEPDFAGSVIVHDAHLPMEPAVRQRMVAGGARILPLGGDVVRQWRDVIAPLLQTSGAQLLGITGWPDFLMLRGLAAESRRHVRHESLAPQTGMLTWLIR